jgi:TonB family protein
MSLFLLTLAPDSEFPIVNRSVVLIAISRSDCLAALDEADVCPSVCPDDRTAVFRVSGHVEPPVIDQRVEPAYPEGARRERVEGPVTIEAVITEEGCIKGVRVLKTLDPRLDFEAARAVSQWKYRPAHLDGRPVSVYLTVNVTYALKK